MTDQNDQGRHFPFRYDPRLSPMWLPFWAWPGTQGVTVTDDGRLVARYGPFHVDAPLSRVQDAHITGPYRWWTAVGPRRSQGSVDSKRPVASDEAAVGGQCHALLVRPAKRQPERGQPRLVAIGEMTVLPVAGFLAARCLVERRHHAPIVADHIVRPAAPVRLW